MAAKVRKNGKSKSPKTQAKHATSTRSSRGTEEDFKGNRVGVFNWCRSLSVWNLAFFTLAITFGALQFYHISTMFEKDRFFSHLSDLEREMSFRSEMGLYFSYYKEMTEAPSINKGLYSAMQDKTVEYPNTVNALKRFNIYPEIFLGILKRGYESLMRSMNKPTKMCYTVKRGRGLSHVQNCEGMGDIAIFYINCIFFWNGVMMSLFFAVAVILSGSIFGGIIAVAAFFYNHGECTRVQWTPPLRESMAYPFFILQLLAVTYTLRIPRPRWTHSASIMLPSLCFILCWQFAQFTLLTQMLSIFTTFVLGFIGYAKLKCILQGQSVALVAAYFLLFGNEMLLTSYFPACLITLWVIVFLKPVFQKVSNFLALWILQGFILITGIVSFKFLISTLLHIADDAHIGNLLRTKLSNYQDFHTMLYVCSREFDFIEMETIIKLSMSFLLPCVSLTVILVGYFLLKQEYDRFYRRKSGGLSSKDQQEILTESKEGAEYIYHIFQTLAFTVMAVLIMRLKLFLTPQLCLMSSLLASRKVLNFIKEPLTHQALVVALVAVMSVKGFDTVREQRSPVGDFENAQLEDTLEWIKSHTPRGDCRDIIHIVSRLETKLVYIMSVSQNVDAVFAGAMPTMAAVKLSTKRPIVNHPHYEDSDLRERTKRVYTIYSRKPAKEVYKALRDLHIKFVILEHSWCIKRYKPGCSLPEIWDVEDPKNRNLEPLCLKLKRHPGPYFKEVFKNRDYTILQLSKKMNSSDSLGKIKARVTE